MRMSLAGQPIFKTIRVSPGAHGDLGYTAYCLEIPSTGVTVEIDLHDSQVLQGDKQALIETMTSAAQSMYGLSRERPLTLINSDFKIAALGRHQLAKTFVRNSASNIYTLSADCLGLDQARCILRTGVIKGEQYGDAIRILSLMARRIEDISVPSPVVTQQDLNQFVAAQI
jgi:hypothetical protein